jgi:hypothetical protein
MAEDVVAALASAGRKQKRKRKRKRCRVVNRTKVVDGIVASVTVIDG